MPPLLLRPIAVLALSLLISIFIFDVGSAREQDDTQHFTGNRVLLGTVEEVRSDQARVNTGEGQPRFVPMNVRKDKGLLDLKKGDHVEITVNEQNLLVDVHKAGESSHHRVIHGQLAEPLDTGHDKAVIRTKDGKEESHLVRPVARSKVASMPVGADVIVLIDELDKIVDVTMLTAESVHRSAELGQQKSPLKGNLTQIAGVIVKPLKNNAISIRTEDGKEHVYEARPLIQEKLAHLSRGQSATLLVDAEQKVTDVAFNETETSHPRQK